jgi:hypothetical protein
MMKFLRESGGIRQWFRIRNYRREMDRNHERHDVFLVSFPKCGRTWHRVLVGYYLARLTNSDVKTAPNVSTLSKAAGVKRLCYTHNGSSPMHRLPPAHDLVANPREWRGKDVVLLVRDPRDVLVSAYFHMNRRERMFDGSISEFLRTPAMGVEKLVSAWSRWHRNRHLAASFSVTSYEAMHRDPRGALLSALRTLGIDRIDDSLVSEAVEFASFGNLRRLEASNYFQSRELINETGDAEAAKVRQGKVGSYRSVLSPEDVAYIEKEVLAIGDPFSTLSDRRVDATTSAAEP